MNTRHGKIAQVRREIRETLNRRLDDGEQGVQLLKWLNNLPEVQELLAREFDGRAINEVNLYKWRRGGFLDWKARQEALAAIQELSSEEPVEAQPGRLAQRLTGAVMAHYAAAVFRSNANMSEKAEARARRLGQTLKELDCVRRREQTGQRIEIERERLELLRPKLKRPSAAGEPAPLEESATEPPLTEEQKIELLKEILLPKDL